MTATHVRATTAALMIIVLVSALWAGVSAAERASHGAEGGIGIVTKSDESVAACFIGEEIAPELRQALGALADKAWTMLEKQDWDGLRKLSGADETRSGSKDAFVEGLTEAAERLGRPIDAAADELFVFRFSGAFSGVAVCGAAEAADPKHAAVQVSSKGEPLAFVLRRSRQPPFERIITFVFRGADKDWRFAGLVGSDVGFVGKDSEDYAKSAEAHRASGDYLAELVELEIAHAFSKTAPFIERSQSYELARRLKALITDSARFDTVRNMKADGADYVLREVTVETTRTGIRPRLVYLSRHPVGDPRGAEEAKALAAYIAENHPATAKEFSDVLLEALATPEKGGEPTPTRYLESLSR